MTDSELRARLLSGLVIPALPLALDEQRRWSERHQRGLVRYYNSAGAGGLAVAVHSTQFEIRDPKHALFEPVLRLAAETMNAEAAPDFVRIAGICGRTWQALREAELAASLGYHAALISPSSWKVAPDAEFIAHCRAIAEIMPIVGFYLQPAVGGRVFSYNFWRKFAEIKRVVAIKIAPFNRYQTLEVIRAVTDAGRDDIALYTGNDDSILTDLLTTWPGGRQIVGGLLGQWGVWTQRAVQMLEEVKAARAGASISTDWLTKNAALTDANAAVFDAAHHFHGCIPGILEVLRRQGLVPSVNCLNPDEKLSPGQAAELTRVAAAYPWLTDDEFVATHRAGWLGEDSSAQPAPVEQEPLPALACEILSASVTFREQPFAKPLQLSGGTITEITEATATVRVRCGGQEAEGHGSIYLSDLWAWPDPSLTHAERDAEMRRLCEALAILLSNQSDPPDHPLAHGLRLHAEVSALKEEAVPLLARLVCASPFDAAIHDACGRATGRSAFSFYDEDCAIPAADALFNDGAVRSIRSFLLPQPADAVDGWYVVSGTDPLTDDFAHFVQYRGFRCFKLKTHGKDPQADARRTVEVFQAARALGVASPRLSADSNEGNPDADSVLAYLDALQEMEAEAYEALEYLEQPTGRDIRRHAFDWHAVSARKPVLIDEGLMSEEIFPDIIAQGWGGICLKTCKGHSFNLIAGAWAHQHSLKIAVQDLTNPGLAAIHSCLLAQHTPNLNGVELNSPQFTPAANAAWLEREPALFSPTDGTHRISDPHAPGLGGAL